MKAEKNKFLTLSVYFCRVMAFLLLMISLLILTLVVLKDFFPASPAVMHYSSYFMNNIFRVLQMLFLSFLLSGFAQFTKSINEKKMIKSWILRRADILIYLYCCLIIALNIHIIKLAVLSIASSPLPSYMLSPVPSRFVGLIAKIIFWLAFSIVLKRVMKLMEDSYKTESVAAE